ncbi:MAG: type II toxin-antitoxin system VapC family toxin [Geminicoccaceae bacterium]|jgi:ribonuclease VapC
MVLDTSAIVAILEDEPERERFVRQVAGAEVRLLSAVSRVECTCVVEGRKRDAGRAELDLFLREAAIEIAPVTADQAEIACEAFRRFGRGRHPAGLNIGDTFAYALAKATGEPLLYKGADFSRTDVDAA